MISFVLVLLMGCEEAKKADTGFYIDINDTDSTIEPAAEASIEPGDEPDNEPDNPNTDPDNDTDTDTGPGNDTDTGPGNDTDTGINGGDETTDDDGDGYSEEQGDCDDNNGQVSPGFTDFPGDGIDQDCSGADAVLVSLPVDWSMEIRF